MKVFKRKQLLKNSLLTFAKGNKTDVYNVQTDVNKSYWLFNGVFYDSGIFNLKAAKKVKSSFLPKDTVYYVTTIGENQRKLFNV